MSPILLMMLAFLGALVGLIFLSNLYTKLCVRLIVHRKHEWLEIVQDTGQPPPEWLGSYRKRVEANRGFDGLPATVVQRTTRRLLRKLDALIRYARITTLVQGDESRRQIVANLTQTRHAWEQGNVF